MKNHVLLIFASLKEDPATLDTETYRPPLGILTIAGPLLEEGFTVTILDERVELDFSNTLKKELSKGPICVGISSMSGWPIKNSLRISRYIKENTRIPVVWGGVHTSLFPGHVINNEYVDYIVIDDGEETLPQLLKCIDGGGMSDLGAIKGIGFKKNGKSIITDTAPPADISKNPPVPLHLLDFSKYTQHKTREISHRSGLNVNHNIPVETSRGCPYSCSFCTESKRKKKWRALSPTRVISDIKHYIKVTGSKGFSIVDDNFFGQPSRGREIIDLLVKENLDISWHTNVTARLVSNSDEQFLHQMEKSGCKLLVMGAESGSPRILKMIDVKKATVEDIIEANRKLAKTNIISSFICIEGFPTETAEDIKKTFMLSIKLLTENGNAINSNVFLIPTPATVIADMALGEKIKTMGLEDWSEIFDLRMDKRHPWVLDETYVYLRKNRYMFAVFRLANRVPAPLNKLVHLLLALFKIKLKYNIDLLIDRIILNFIFDRYEVLLKILKRVFRISLVGV